MKKLAGLIISLLLLVATTSLFGAHASASQQPVDQCDQVFTYLLPEGHKVHDNRVTVDFHNLGSKHNAIIDVIAQSGYQVTEVDLSVGVDQQTATVYTYTTGDLVGFNPPGSEDIEYTQVKVKKVCTTPTPTATPTPTTNGCAENHTGGDAVNPDKDGDETCPTPTLTVTPTPSVTQTPNPTPTTTSANTPQCSDRNTTNVPANLQVSRNGDKATVSFFITDGDTADILYKDVNASNWQYSVTGLTPNAEKFVSTEIGGLNTNTEYTFGARQRFGCGGGDIVTTGSGISEAQVLGASTMAGTGTFEEKLMNLYAIFGMLLVAAGFTSYAKEKRLI